MLSFLHNRLDRVRFYFPHAIDFIRSFPYSYAAYIQDTYLLLYSLWLYSCEARISINIQWYSGFKLYVALEDGGRPLAHYLYLP